ncbi:Uncharacterised protein [uncultured archaeon]|nr:Uncharacterised protein [uncultured archaeon]
MTNKIFQDKIDEMFGETLIVHYKNTRIEFARKVVGREGYDVCMRVLDSNDLQRPTTKQILLLLQHLYRNKKEKFYSDFLNELQGETIFCGTENLYCSEGVIVFDNVDGKMPNTKKELLRRMREGDKAIRMINWGFKTSSSGLENVLKNPYVLAQVGSEDMLEVLHELYLQQPKAMFGLLSRNPLHVRTLERPIGEGRLYEPRTETSLDFGANANFLNIYSCGGCCPRGGNVPIIKSISNS